MTHARRGTYGAALAFAATLVFLLCGASGCSGSDDGGSSDVEAVLATAADLPDPEPKSVAGAVTSSTKLVGNETWICKTTRMSVNTPSDTFPLFDPNAEVIWPGSLLQGASLQAATPTPIPVRRGPGTVVLTLMTGAEAGVSRTVPELSMSSVYDASNDILFGMPDTVPARFSFTMDRVHSEEQLSISAGANFNGFGADVKASLAFSKDQTYNRFLVRLNQSFYTLAVQPPASAAAAFAPTVGAADLEGLVGPGNPATYVSSVTYGRIFYLLFESTDRETKMEAALNATFSGWGVTAGGNVDTNYVNSLSQLHVKAFALGGNAGDALAAVTGDFEQLKTFLATGGSIRSGAPISYVVRSLRHPEKVVKVGLGADYDVTNCQPIAETFGTPIFWYAADDVGASGSTSEPAEGADVPLWKDRSGAQNDAYRDITDLTVTAAPKFRRLVVNGIKPAVEFSNTSRLHLYGGDFVAPPTETGAYTIFLVAAITKGPTGSAYFLDGAVGGPGHGVRAGFRNPTEFGFDNGNAGAYAAMTAQPGAFHVYTFAYSHEGGMTVFRDGLPFTYAPTATDALTDYLGVDLGITGDDTAARVSIAEVMAHRAALTPAQRTYLEGDLMRKYRF